MIYRGVKMQADEQKKQDRRDILKAVAIAACAVALFAAAYYLTLQLGIR